MERTGTGRTGPCCVMVGGRPNQSSQSKVKTEKKKKRKKKKRKRRREDGGTAPRLDRRARCEEALYQGVSCEISFWGWCQHGASV